MTDINSVLDEIKKYYTSNNLNIPTNAVEYIANYPKGFSRQVLKTKYGLTTSQVVMMLNPTYRPPMVAKDRASVEATRLGYTLLTNQTLISNNRDIVLVKCNNCGYEHSTSITSMSGTKLGCPKCKSGNLPWNKRREELEQIAKDRLDSEVISGIPSNQTGYITLRHICGTEYTTQLVGIVSPTTTLRGTCPNCRPSDRRITIDGITFGSEFEYKCYLLLQPLSPELHVPYSKYLDTKRKWVCDFKVGVYWIEVSNFKQDFKNYFHNIEEKRDIVDSSGYVFLFVTSLKELEELISLM